MDWRIEKLEVAESTNDVARERLLACWGRGESAAGIVVVAARQTGGRGQHGRRWESPVGGLYLSAVVEDISPALRGKLALVAGVAAAEAIGGLSGVEGLRLRWPNDLMIGGKKVGGILCEAVAMGEQKWAGIVGIGINVRAKVDDFPQRIARAGRFAGGLCPSRFQRRNRFGVGAVAIRAGIGDVSVVHWRGRGQCVVVRPPAGARIGCAAWAAGGRRGG